MKSKFLIDNENICWCNYCMKKIHIGETYMYIYRTAYRGNVRINICPLCLKKISKEINKKYNDYDLRKMRNKMKTEEVIKAL